MLSIEVDQQDGMSCSGLLWTTTWLDLDLFTSLVAFPFNPISCMLSCLLSIFKFAFFKFLAISCPLFASFGNLDIVLKLLYHAVPHFGGHRLPFFPNA